MAGYVFTLDSIESLKAAARVGAFGPYLSLPQSGVRWGPSQEGTFADFATMKPGDNVYFFFNRNIYGIGELIEIGGDSRHINFPNASEPTLFDYEDIREDALLDSGPRMVNQRWICTFVPSPRFFVTGVDMDDALSSKPSAFRMLRVMWNVSFIKLDDEENQALRDILLRRNLAPGSEPKAMGATLPSLVSKKHPQIEKKKSAAHSFLATPILEAAADGDWIKHEMALEAGILWQLAEGEAETVSALGKWDYLSHQVMASPFKPLIWADRVDIFGYAWLGGFRPTTGRYLVCEVKKGSASQIDVDQVMKYVDWVKDEYAGGDYGTIQAFLVAYDFAEDTVGYVNEVARRIFTIGRRPAVKKEWNNLQLLRYRWKKTTKRLHFEPVAV